MGKNYSSSAVVGYVVTDLRKFFGDAVRHRDEVSHMEDRYDTRTGRVTHQEKVVERHECDYVVLGDEEFEVDDDCYVDSDMAEALGALLDADVSCGGDFGIRMLMTIEPRLDGEDDVVSIDDLAYAVAQVHRIGDRCRELGFDPGPAGVHSVLNAC